MDKYYIQGFGFTESECEIIIQCYNGVLHRPTDEHASYRADLLASLSEKSSGLDDIEGMVDAGMVEGDAYQNFASLGDDRNAFRAIVAKVEALTEAQAREIHGYCFGFWDAIRSTQA